MRIRSWSMSETCRRTKTNGLYCFELCLNKRIGKESLRFTGRVATRKPNSGMNTDCGQHRCPQLSGISGARIQDIMVTSLPRAIHRRGVVSVSPLREMFSMQVGQGPRILGRHVVGHIAGISAAADVPDAEFPHRRHAVGPPLHRPAPTTSASSSRIHKSHHGKLYTLFFFSPQYETHTKVTLPWKLCLKLHSFSSRIIEGVPRLIDCTHRAPLLSRIFTVLLEDSSFQTWTAKRGF
jgi:hypothetical protein